MNIADYPQLIRILEGNQKPSYKLGLMASERQKLSE